ncbi:MAG: hypothetical protein C0603_09760 [Denitrovibrio sp.]|nr:MAG: hypothetical protein C0603_09760 [Denitrovibrio sp.]
MKQPKISIIITAYNRYKSLRKALYKAFEQNYENKEIIVLDDCSNIDLSSVIKSFPLAKFISNTKNIGCAANSLKGIAQASGEYVIITADDDMLDDNNFLSNAARFFPEYDAVFGRCTIVDEGNIFLSKYQFKQAYSGKDFLIQLAELDFDFQQYISLSSFIFNKEKLLAISPFNSYFHNAISVDIATIVKFCFNAKKIRFIDTSAYQWTKATNDSLSGTNKKDLTFQAKNLLSAALDISSFSDDSDLISINNKYIENIFDRIVSDYNQCIHQSKLLEKIVQMSSDDIYIVSNEWGCLSLMSSLAKMNPPYNANVLDMENLSNYTEEDRSKTVYIIGFSYKVIYNTLRVLHKAGFKQVIDFTDI